MRIAGRKYPYIVLILSILTLSIYGQEVISPLKNDTLYHYDSYDIRFKGFKRDQKKVTIALFKDGKKQSTLVSSWSRFMKYQWPIDSGITPGGGYSITVMGEGAQPVSCSSGQFFIQQPTISVTKPKGGEVWEFKDSLHSSVSWNCQIPMGTSYRIDLLREKTLIMTMKEKTTLKGGIRINLNQNAPVTTAENYQVKVTLLADTTIFGLSKLFSITRMKYNFSRLKNIPIAWMPKENVMEEVERSAMSHLSNVKVTVGTFTDQREKVDEIAVNLEQKEKRYVTTNESVADWCRTNFIRLMKYNNLNPSNREAAIIIYGKVQRYFVTETSTYNAIVVIEYSLVDRSGNVLWEGVKQGEEKNWGTSYSAHNYYESLAGAFSKTVILLFSDSVVLNILNNPPSTSTVTTDQLVEEEEEEVIGVE